MYENLLKRLRKAHERQLWMTTPDDTVRTLFSESADAIVEMQRCLDGIEADNDSLCAKLEELSKPKWIPVSEKKPPLPENENICFVQVIAAIKGKNETEPVTYCRVYRYRDGKRERIERFVGDGEVVEVTHWMPMPEPPEEDKE